MAPQTLEELLSIQPPNPFKPSTRVGVYDGVQVYLAQFYAGRERLYSMTARAPFGADLDLRLEHSGFFLEGSRTFTIESAQLASICQWDCAPGDASIAGTLFDSHVCDDLLTIARLSTVSVRDDGVRAIYRGFESADVQIALARAAVSAVKGLDARLLVAPTPTPLRAEGVAEALLATASEMGLFARAHPLTLWGPASGDELVVRYVGNVGRRFFSDGPFGVAEPDAGAYARVRFAEPLGVGLRLRSATWLDRAQSAVGLKDLQVGDAAFDRAWRIDATDEAGARALLTPSFRKTVDELATLRFEIEITDQGLTARAPLARNATEGTRALRLLAAVRSAMRTPLTLGPYR